MQCSAVQCSAEVISDAVRGFKKLVEAEEGGGRPVDRPREYQEASRRRQREEKGSRYYRKERRGTRVRALPTPRLLAIGVLQGISFLNHLPTSKHVRCPQSQSL